MTNFWIWFSTGMEHILDLSGYDHILFVSLLVLTFPLKDWSKLLWLITAFTLGHSVSLAISAGRSDLFLPRAWVEFFIAFSILTTASYNLILSIKGQAQSASQKFVYPVVAAFGLVHGLGFSVLLTSMLGHAESVVLPLLYFNLGLEAGQLIIVLGVILFSLLLAFLFKWPFHIYKLTLVCIIGLIALKISAERLWEVLQFS